MGVELSKQSDQVVRVLRSLTQITTQITVKSHK